MVVFLIAMVLWTVMGTATFRRVGHAAIESAPKHTKSCNINSGQHIIRRLGDGYNKCLKCDQYKRLIDKWGYHFDDKAKRRNCTFEENEIRWTGEVCDCGGTKAEMVSAAVASYMLWPALLVIYASINAQKKFLDYKGENWSFFVPAKIVQTKSQRIEQLEANIKQLEKVTDMPVLEKQDV
jgi:hypothetical protein